ncbi:hypothetical protein Patl1_23826 [Pistacia atlantica]|uniref:Uncharacterized protein n=1 Tax=Pistacia atlantica TaxID=434234 RepID=A0ACC0ZZ24_9ROSI|nr:hypothetical protein Patl1_23826 [Pistacia atlantica]
MKYVAFTSSWKWKEFESKKGKLPELIFGAFNFPERGENLLAKVEYTPSQLYFPGKPMEEIFWLQVDSKWFNVSTQLQDLELQQSYREFLFKELNVSTVDEESAAIVMTCLSNGVPSIVFRGVSDLAGGGEKLLSSSLSSLASVNALIVAVEFIALIDKENTVHDHQKQVSFSAL